MKNVPIPKGSTVPADPQAAQKAFSQLVSAWIDYKKTKEIEKTKREQIEVWKVTTIKRLDNQRDILELYLKETFKERRIVIKEMFDRLDQGISNEDSQLVSMAMQSIITTVKTSPLQGVQQILTQIENNDSDEVIEI